ncbi:MAG: hypothetical protein ABIG11_00895, partial [bacterium]
MLPPAAGGEQIPGSYGIPDLSKHRAVQTIELDNEVYVRMVRDILASGESGAILALKSNIHQFHEQIRDKAS